MGTIFAIHKNNLTLVGADCCNVRESSLNKQSHAELSCILRVGDGYIALNSTIAFQTAFETALQQLIAKEPPRLTDRASVHTFFLRMHELLRNHGFMYVAFQQGQDFEWTPMSALVVNRAGIFRVDSARSVIECSRFCALGSGEAYALGAIAAQYDALDIEELSRSTLRTLHELDPLSGRAEFVFTLRSPALVVAPPPAQRPAQLATQHSSPKTLAKTIKGRARRGNKSSGPRQQH